MNILIAVTGIAIALALLEIYRELHSFQVVDYNIGLKKKGDMGEEKTIIFLSDLHNHVYGKDNGPLLEAIRDKNPDLILIGGDMLVGKRGRSFQNALEFVKELPSVCPVYYANGNHEQRMKENPDEYSCTYVKYRQELTLCGVKFLENSSVYTNLGETNIRITGLEIPLSCYRHFGKGRLTEGELTARIGMPEDGVYQILLAHNPDYTEEYIRWGADLILSGHLHGGIVRIPGITGMISPSFRIFPQYSGGHYKDGDTSIVVSKGLGTHTLNIRLFNQAEVVVLRLFAEVRRNRACAKEENPV